MAHEALISISNPTKYLLAMESKELGDVMFALKYCFEFYGKRLDKQQEQVWKSIIRNNSYSSFQWQAVLKQYFQIGKFAPKPPEILELLTMEAERTKGKEATNPQSIVTNCPEDISSAWRYWIPKFWGEALPFQSDESEVSTEQAEEWLYTVNREAKRTKNPDAIPETYKIEDIWNGRNPQRQGTGQPASVTRHEDLPVHPRSSVNSLEHPTQGYI